VCFSNLRFVFIVFYVWQRVRAWLRHERVRESLKWERIFVFYKMRVIQRIVKRISSTMLDFFFFFVDARHVKKESRIFSFLVVFHDSHIQHESWRRKKSYANREMEFFTLLFFTFLLLLLERIKLLEFMTLFFGLLFRYFYLFSFLSSCSSIFMGNFGSIIWRMIGKLLLWLTIFFVYL